MILDIKSVFVATCFVVYIILTISAETFPG